MGFWLGSLTLIIIYVAVQPGSAKAATAGGNVIVATLRRALSPDVAGIPQRGSSTPTPTPAPAGGGGGRVTAT